MATRAPVSPFERLILGDPLYRQTAANLSAQGIAAASERDQGLQNALVNFGAVPNIGQAAGGLGLDPNSPLARALAASINPQVANAAVNNPFSTEAQLAHNHQVALGGILDNLGARGGFQQGAYGSAATAENQGFGQKEFDAHQALLSYLTGIQHAFATQQQTAANQLGTAAQGAANRAIALNPVLPAAPGMTPHAIAPALNIRSGQVARNTTGLAPAGIPAPAGPGGVPNASPAVFGGPR